MWVKQGDDTRAEIHLRNTVAKYIREIELICGLTNNIKKYRHEIQSRNTVAKYS